jgi:hypothetical protein
MGLLRGFIGAPRRTSMGPLRGPHKREKIKLYLRGHKVGPYLVARKSGKSALMGPLEGP